MKHITSQLGYPQIDCFASPGNTKLPKFISRWPHFQAHLVNALQCPLQDIQICYANPPWNLIFQWLLRLKHNPHIICYIMVPYWVSSNWWPLLLKLHVKGTPSLLIHPFPGMFQNCLGDSMPQPKWPLLCTCVSGKHWRPNKSHLHISKVTWTP